VHPPSSARSKRPAWKFIERNKTEGRELDCESRHRLERKMLPFYLAFAAVFFPFPAAGQNRAFTVESEVAVRADSFACKETSELDRLLQCNQCGGFASGTHLYNYLKANK
jgi:hypothetical protein